MIKSLSENVLFVQFVVLLALVVLDVVVAVAIAIKQGSFEWSELLTFMRTNVAPYALVWAALASLGWGASELQISNETLTALTVMVNAPYAFIMAKLLNSIYASLKKLGLQPPE